MQNNACAALLILLLSSVSPAAEVATPDEIQRMDAVATMMQSMDKWFTSNPHLAIVAVEQLDQMLNYAKNKIAQHENAQGRTADRVAQLKNAVRNLQPTIDRFQRNAPVQVDSALKRVEREITRMRSTRPNPRMFHSMVKNSMPRARTHFKILNALGAVSPELETRFAAAEKQIAIIEANNANALAKLNRVPRDRYRSDDREAIESAILTLWKAANPEQKPTGVIMPEMNWQYQYGAIWNSSTNEFDTISIETLEVLVKTDINNSTCQLYPFTIKRPKDANGPIDSWRTSESRSIVVLSAQPR